MKTCTHFGQSLVLTALVLAVLISCFAEGIPGSGQTPAGGGGDGNVLVSNMGDLQPPFDETVLTGYEVEVPAGTSQIGFNYGDEEVPELQVSGEITGDENPYTVTLEINGEQKNYEITVVVMPSADITAITLSADDFTGENAITINNPADYIAQSAPYLNNPPPITVALTLSDAAAAPAYGGDFQTWTPGSLSNAIAVTVGATVDGSITITTTKDIAGHERITSREYTVSISRPDQQPLASGGVVEFIAVGGQNYDEVHVFKSTDSLVFSTTPNKNAQVFLVAGGGGGGGKSAPHINSAGAGGAGGLLAVDAFMLDADSWSVVIGAGGAGGVSINCGVNGGDSVFAKTGAAVPANQWGIWTNGISARGGGGGAGSNSDLDEAQGPKEGGSGGGGSGQLNGSTGHKAAKANPSGDDAQGHDGAPGTGNLSYMSGGGGGAGGPGNTINGGPGKNASEFTMLGGVSGIPAGFAGGGAGSNYGTKGTASHGGGSQAAGSTNNGTGEANTGGGGRGGGGNNVSPDSNAGGSGIVIVCFPHNY